MKKLIFVMLSMIFVGSVSAASPGQTGAVLGLSYIPHVEHNSEETLENPDSDHMYVFSFSGLNVNTDSNYFMQSGLFFQFGFSEYAFQKRDFNFKQHKMFNLGMTVPFNNGFYGRLGGGMYWMSTQLENGDKKEEERLLNGHVGAGYFITDRITLGLNYDTGPQQVGFEMGFQF